MSTRYYKYVKEINPVPQGLHLQPGDLLPISPMPGSGKGLRRFVEEIGHGVSASGPVGAFEIGY